MIDMHVHTSLSYDSSESAENYIRAAIGAGEEFLGFAEHYDYDDYLCGGDASPCDLTELERRTRELNLKYPRVKVLKGIELGYSKPAVARYKEILKQPFDYAILSVHTLEGRGDCYYPAFFKGLTKEQAYGAYLNAVLDSVRSPLDYQIVGHIGYVSRYAPYADRLLKYRDFSVLFDEIFREIISRGACLELNTSADGTGLDFLPDREAADAYVALGGRNFTFGSDAHSVKNYMRGCASVREYLLSRGIDNICYFENGELKRKSIK